MNIRVLARSHSYACGWYAQPSPEVHYRTAYERATTYVNVLFGMRYRFNSLLDWSDVRFFRQCDGEPTVYCSECDNLYTKSHDCFAEDEDIDFLFKSHPDCTSDCSYGAVYTGSASLWEVARLLESKKPCGMYYQDFSVKSGLGNCYGNYPSEMPYATHRCDGGDTAIAHPIDDGCAMTTSPAFYIHAASTEVPESLLAAFNAAKRAARDEIEAEAAACRTENTEEMYRQREHKQALGEIVAVEDLIAGLASE